jgi:hypothetical protein
MPEPYWQGLLEAARSAGRQCFFCNSLCRDLRYMQKLQMNSVTGIGFYQINTGVFPGFGDYYND